MAGLNDVIHQAAVVTATAAGWTGDVKEYSPWLEPAPSLPLAYIWATSVDESRRPPGGLGGGSGKKINVYQVTLELRNNTRQPELDEAIFRTTIDAIKAVWRTNQLLAGVTIRFGEDIQTVIDEPVADGTSVNYRATLTSEAWELFNA